MAEDQPGRTPPRSLQASQLVSELVLTTSRSGGPGGQHVNKVSSKITLSFDIPRSRILTSEEKEILLSRLGTRLTKHGVLILRSDASRSQLQNRENAVIKLDQVLKKAFAKRKKRKATRPTKSSVQGRITKKKKQGEKKKWRQRPDLQ